MSALMSIAIEFFMLTLPSWPDLFRPSTTCFTVKKAWMAVTSTAMTKHARDKRGHDALGPIPLRRNHATHDNTGGRWWDHGWARSNAAAAVSTLASFRRLPTI